MLREVAPGVQVRTSGWVATSTVVVDGPSGVLLVDPGVLEEELTALADELAGRPVVAGFATHPHWDHLLWHPVLGEAPRWATALAAGTARARLANGVDRERFGIPDEVALDLLGDVTGLPEGATSVPWDGPVVRVLEHHAHAPGHAADPVGDHLAALTLLEEAAGDAAVVVPGHGSVGGAGAVRKRIAADRAYLEALRDGRDPEDPRVDAPAEGWERVRGVHEGQLAALADRG